MAKSSKGKTAAKVIKGAPQENTVPKELENPLKVDNRLLIVRTTNMQVSEKLQKAGIGVFAITGGIIGDDKKHYFRTNLAECSNITSISKDELALLEEVDEVTPSKKLYSGLKEAVTSGKPEKQD